MYRFYINNIENDYHFSELCRVYLDDDSFEVIGINLKKDTCLHFKDNSFLINSNCSHDKDEIKKELFLLLEELTGIHSDWGILTGVRPLKLAYEIFKNNDSIDKTNDILKNKYCVSDSKANILCQIMKYQLENVKGESSKSIAIYIGIPFCPTRCNYCSFASNVASIEEIEKYLDNLLKEIEYTAQILLEKNTNIESVYIGGGTPTTLNSEQLERLIKTSIDRFKIDPNTIEYTIEAGRPDTISADKLEIMRKYGISRISINPQTMKDNTLKLIGRKHNSQDIINSYKLSEKYEFNVINADLIAGLPEESFDDFKHSLDKVISLGANNITIHTLSVKSGSRLKNEDPDYYRRNTIVVSQMLQYAHQKLLLEGFCPYYIYRQKHQIGAQENIGYCKPGKHSIYNIRIMDDKQTIIGLGAGAIGKIYYPNEDRLERVPNVSNYQIYNERFDEMIERKKAYYGG